MLRSINPTTGKEIAVFPQLTAAELEVKLDCATSTYQTWRRSSVDQRVELLTKLAALYDTNKNQLAKMATDEMGKTYASAIAEIEKCADAFRYYAQKGPAMLSPVLCDKDGKTTSTLYWQPIGVILAVMPWNFPFWQVVRFLAPTILAGNVGLLKHASNVQGVAGLMIKMMNEAGAPEGLFQNLSVTSDKIGGLIADSRIAAVTLTGSEGAGMAVAEQAGRNLKKIVLELGGSDPFIVMPSANLDEAVRQAVKARIQNTGQSCVCAKRMIVHTDIYDLFFEKFSAAIAAVKAGDPMDSATDMGPLSSHKQRDTVLGQIDEAVKQGAKLLVGGKALAGEGAFMSAGILTDVPLDSDCAREEIFGPIATVYRAKNIDDAIHIANSTPFGLGSSVWTQDETEQRRFIDDINAGMTAINQMLASSPTTPFGGTKRSGYGRELGPFGLHEFMNLKTVSKTD